MRQLPNYDNRLSIKQNETDAAIRSHISMIPEDKQILDAKEKRSLDWTLAAVLVIVALFVLFGFGLIWG